MARTLAQRRETEAQVAEEAALKAELEAAEVAARKKMKEDEETVRKLKDLLRSKQEAAAGKPSRDTKNETQDINVTVAPQGQKYENVTSHETTGETRRQTEKLKERAFTQAASTILDVAGNISEEVEMTTKSKFAESFNARMARIQQENAAREYFHDTEQIQRLYTKFTESAPQESVRETTRRIRRSTKLDSWTANKHTWSCAY
jgi:hypothetical protein